MTGSRGAATAVEIELLMAWNPRQEKNRSVTRRRTRATSLRPLQSGLIWAALMIGHHFSISALWWRASVSGVC